MSVAPTDPPTGVGPRDCRCRLLRFDGCASSTPPTGISGGPSTGRACSATRRRTSTTCSRSSESERVDLVVLAGDVYDRALPPVDAVALADEAFTRLAASRARLVVTSGNHDSAQRLGFGSRADRRRRGAPAHRRRPASARRCCSSDDHGPVAVYGLPYLDPDPSASRGACPHRSHEAALAEAMRRVRADLAARPRRHPFGGAGPRVRRRAAPPPASPSATSASAGSAWCPRSVFDGVDYTALGHLHGPHTLTETVRYSGSPLAYSFSEADHVKGSWLVELGADGLTAAEFVAAPVPRPLARLRGALDDLLADPALHRPRGRLGAGDAHRRRPARASRWSGCAAASRTRCAQLRAAPARAPAPDPASGPPPGAPTTTIALDFLDELRGAPGQRRRVRAAPRRLRRLHARPRPRPRRGRRGRLMRLHPSRSPRSARSPRRSPSTSTSCRRPACSCSAARPGPARPSVLDAVCFALYGDVPGDRSSAKRFRCDTAPRRRWPRGWSSRRRWRGRRFRLTRSPAWQRPKKRGSGHTTEQAHVLIEEHVDDAWVALSNRMDEAGHLVTDLRRDDDAAVLPGRDAARRAASRPSCGPAPRSGTGCSSSCSAPSASRTWSAGCASTPAGCTAAPRPGTARSPGW